MSVASPPKRPPSRGREDDRPPRQRDSGRYEPGLLGRAYAAAMAPFRLQDGRGRLRALLLGGLFVFSIFAARLIDLQAVHADSLAKEARGSRTVAVKQPAERGAIYDANGLPLAQTIPARNITVDPFNVKDPADYARKLAPLLGMMEPDIVKAFTQVHLANGDPLRFAYIKKEVTLDVANQINDLKLPGIFSEPAALRYYPSGSLASNILGEMGYDTDRVTFKGLSGIEGAYEKELSGVDGSKSYERSASGGEIPTGNDSQVDPIPGSSFKLTINSDLQFIAQNAIEKRAREVRADNAVVVVMERGTNRIFALAQSPTSDPKDPKRSALGSQNLAVTQVFEPGSTEKVVSMSAIVEEGKADPSTVFTVPNRLPVDGFTFKDDIDHPTYKMTLAGILAQSSNIGTIKAAQLIGPDKLYEYIKKFGVGTPSGLNYPGELRGYIPERSKWSDLTFPNVAYGQGMSVNAIQMATIFSTIANMGVKVTPRLIDSMTRPDGTTETAPPSTAERVISEATARTVITMMEQVVGKYGTAPGAAIPGYRVAGKTGTAQMFDEATKTYKGWVASFIGMAPADDPKLIVAVITRNPKTDHFGSTTGGPVFKEVMSAALRIMKIPPSGEKSPQLPMHAKDSPKTGIWNRPR